MGVITIGSPFQRLFFVKKEIRAKERSFVECVSQLVISEDLAFGQQEKVMESNVCALCMYHEYMLHV